MSPVLTIYCDFDGIITQTDSINFILERLADPEWKVVKREWMAGQISYQEYLSRQISLVQGGWPAIRLLLWQIRLDPTFAPFAKWCHNQNIPLVIVSESIEQAIRLLLAREEIEISDIRASQLKETTEGTLSLVFPDLPVQSTCLSTFCKCRLLSPKSGLLNIVIGGGLSNRCWVRQADTVFAKSMLQTYCQQNKIRYYPFENFTSIQKQLEDCLAQIRDIEWESTAPCSETFQLLLKTLSDQ